MENGNLLDQALGGGLIEDASSASRSGGGRVLLIEDCVETSAAFVLHHLIKRTLSPPHSSAALIIFAAFAHPFSHYDRILRKMGCNLAVQRDNKRFVFLDMLTFECPDGDGGGTFEGGLVELYGKIQKAVEVSIVNGGSRSISIMIDDISLLEVAAKGSSNHVLDFLHYCHTLTTEIGCSLAVLNHEDIYSRMERPNLILQMEYLAEVIIKVEPLATGLATDVHGQLTVMNKRNFDGPLRKKSNFHFRVKENNVEYFYPGSRT
ncbi:elongator complex protein 6 isoform X1 [Rhododendron vialii]|uniref:elongator complex protein 6 isoform X1 n=1 Tax=Rhododendron vialii TaxID=182163 RepID=UPI0026603B6C|nr:elongator complex protein 6 isoform X1 [Rhododendron vialii]